MSQQQSLVMKVGSLEVDVPRSIGFFGGIALAVGLGLLEPPLGLFIAAVPFVKMLDRPQVPTGGRFLAEVLDGAAKPVGSSGSGTIQLSGQTSD